MCKKLESYTHNLTQQAMSPRTRLLRDIAEAQERRGSQINQKTAVEEPAVGTGEWKKCVHGMEVAAEERQKLYERMVRWNETSIG